MASDFRLIEDATFVLPSLLGLVAELSIDVFGLSTFLRQPPSGTYGRLDQAIQHCIGSQVHDIFHSWLAVQDRKSTRLNSSHGSISYAVFCLINKIYINR